MTNKICFEVVVCLALIISGSFRLGWIYCAKGMREEAIQAGHAEWVPGEDGKATFKWKEME